MSVLSAFIQRNALPLILGLALILRLWNLGAESAWIDEAYSIDLARHTFSEIIQGAAADQHPPLFYLLLSVWILPGFTVSYVRLLSVFIGVINVFVAIQFGQKMGGRPVGLWAGLLMAISPMHVFYSQEARMYILTALLTLLATSQLWDCLHRKNWWLLYIILSILSIYTHYFAAFILLAHFFWIVVWSFSRHDKRTLFYWLLSMVVVGLLFLPWLPTALNQSRFHTMSWIEPPSIQEILDTFLRLVMGSAVLALPEAGRWLLSGAVGIVCVVGIRRINQQESPVAFYFSLLSILVWIPFLAISIISFTYPIFQFKQFILLVAPVLIWIAWIGLNLPKMWKGLFLMFLVLSNSATLVYQQLTLDKDDWRGVAMYLQENFKPGDVIYCNPAACSPALSIYTGTNLPVLGYPPGYTIVEGGWEGERITPQIGDQEFRSLSEQYQRLWFIEFVPEIWDPNRELESWLSSHAQLLNELDFTRIRVRLYQFEN